MINRNGFKTTLTDEQLLEVGIASHHNMHISDAFNGGKPYNSIEYHLAFVGPDNLPRLCYACQANLERLEKGEPLVYVRSVKTICIDGKWEYRVRLPDGTWVSDFKLTKIFNFETKGYLQNKPIDIIT